jgi:hypothetical protein
MDRVHRADDNQVERIAALEEYLTLARAREGETWFDAGGLERGPCRQLSRARRPGHEPQARPCGSRLAPATPTTSGSMCRLASGTGDIGDHAEALEWLTTGLELALRTGDPESALEQLRPSRASCLSALGRPSGEIQERAAQGKQGETGER